MNFSKSDLEKLSVSDYQVEHEIIVKGNTIFNKMYFRDDKGNLISYISFNVRNQNIAYIIDITNSNGFEYMSEECKKMYIEKGYKSGTEVSGFGTTALNYVLEYIKNEYSNISIVLVNSLKKNESKVLELVEKTKKQTSGLIKRITGGNEISLCTLFLDR